MDTFFQYHIPWANNTLDPIEQAKVVGAGLSVASGALSKVLGTGMLEDVRGLVTAIKEGGQVHLGPRPTRQPPHRPSDTRQRRSVDLNTGQAQGDP